jgi:TonB family protein
VRRKSSLLEQLIIGTFPEPIERDRIILLRHRDAGFRGAGPRFAPFGAGYLGTMWISLVRKVAAVFVVLLLIGVSAGAQQAALEEAKRKVKFKPDPEYPILARRLSLSGKVKIEIVIAADGHVKSTRALGGHPLLVQSCLDVIRAWRYEPSPTETTEVVEFNFKS